MTKPLCCVIFTKGKIMKDQIYYVGKTNHGNGLFAKRRIESGEIIFVRPEGQVYTREELQRDERRSDHFLQVGKDQFVYVDFPEHCLNHSCAPNVRIVGNYTIAMRGICIGEELTVDYSTFMGTDWTMSCGCGSPDCKMVIQGRANYK